MSFLKLEFLKNTPKLFNYLYIMTDRHNGAIRGLKLCLETKNISTYYINMFIKVSSKHIVKGITYNIT